MASLRQLQYFVTVAEEGHMTRAARSLELSQPSLSQAIAQLESQLGVELLVRHPRGVSLTPAGATLFVKARTALAAAEDAELTAQSLARGAGSTLDWGFIGTPPAIEVPEVFAAFVAANPDVEMTFRDLSAPRGSTAEWLAEVDVALCHSPTPHPDVEVLVLREEPRVLITAGTHPLAGREELSVADVIDELFCGTHPALDPVRAGFWTLDDHRGARARVTADRASNAQEWIAVVASGRAVITAPHAIAMRYFSAMPGMSAIPLVDAFPTKLSLLWHRVAHNQHVESVVEAAKASIGISGPETKQGEPASGA